MSIAKVTTVTKSVKDQGECEKCKTPLPKGTAYRWFTVGFRSKHKHRRCLKPECTPKSSELESSKIASVYAAQEEFGVADCTTIADIEQAVHDVAEQVREVVEEYRDAAVDQYGNTFNTEADERADVLESAADELEGFSHDEEFEPCEDHAEKVDEGDVDHQVTEEGPQYECEDCSEAWETFLEDARTAAVEAVDNIETP